MFSYAVIMIIDHTHPRWRNKQDGLGKHKYNGAYYYSQEIVANIIPNVSTDRNWVTILVPNTCLDHSIVFIHNNLHPEYYDYLKDYRDLLLVCGVQETATKLKKRLNHKTIYLPLSVDVEYVKQFIRPKTKDTAYVGRLEKTKYMDLPTGIDYIHGIKRQDMLPIVAEYRKIYAVGRTAVEGRILGCQILNADKRYPKKRWRVLDNKDAAEILQEKLDKIDKCNRAKNTQKSDKD